jgi:hypothetical protein
MPGSSLTLRRPLHLASAAILLVGWVAALLVFLTATRSVDDDVVGYRITGGQAFPITLGHSTRDVQILEAQGGRANLAAAELDAWIGSLWHGRRLSYTLAAVSVALAGLCAGIAHLSIKVVEE